MLPLLIIPILTTILSPILLKPKLLSIF
jgi:hypothetical protein